MQSIKIISNPYQNKIRFCILDSNGWKELDCNDKTEENNPLLNKKYANAFFPFVAKEIVDIIIKEYGEEVNIEFEGTKEAYQDLIEICKEYDGVKLSQSQLFLYNANDVLEEIIKIYNDSRNLIEKSVLDKSEIDRDTCKFLEATSDIIPLCVIGNYSSGKSTFINALIGADILPSGDDPVTSNIYKIKMSNYNSVAKIKFGLEGKIVEIIFDGDLYSIKTSFNSNSLIYQVEDELKKIKKEPMYVKLNRIIDVLNTNSKDILNLEIEVPFVNGILQNSKREFVIFDTPGSDSSTYEKHLKTLQDELHSLSNGLIIFIVDRLDSKGNEKLYKMLKDIKELDSRFTMIVVNKADCANLPERGKFTEDEVNKKMDLAIPRSLYSNGIYFVSSILGLGSKNNGMFINSHNAEFYDTNKEKYSNVSSKYYKQLYNYDIMPGQLRSRMIKDVEKCENKVFANSGLYAVEHEILTFANMYSSYNKCNQAQLFLENVINITGIKIGERKEKLKKYKQALINEMEIEKQNLCEKLNNEMDNYSNCYDEEYENSLNDFVNIIKLDVNYDVSTMSKLEKEIKLRFEKELGLQEQKEKNKAICDDAKAKSKAKKDEIKSLTDFKNIGDFIGSFSEEIAIKTKNFFDEKSLQVNIDRKTSDELFVRVKKEFDIKAENSKNQIYDKSKGFYDLKSEEIKRQLLDLIDVTDALTDVQKSLLKNIIMDYEDIKFNKKSDDIFIENELKVKIFGIFTINKYDSNSLSKVFNENIRDGIDKVFGEISQSHKNSFVKWLYNLVQSLESNIVRFNPALLAKAEEIDNQSKEINLLENDQDKLEHYLIKLKDLIAWKN